MVALSGEQETSDTNVLSQPGLTNLTKKIAPEQGSVKDKGAPDARVTDRELAEIAGGKAADIRSIVGFYAKVSGPRGRVGDAHLEGNASVGGSLGSASGGMQATTTANDEGCLDPAGFQRASARPHKSGKRKDFPN